MALKIYLKGSLVAHENTDDSIRTINTPINRVYYFQSETLAVRVGGTSGSGAVGDFKAEAVEDLIKKSFSMIPEGEGPWEHPFFPVPDHQETLYSVAVDPEIRNSRVTIYIKKDVRESKTEEDYRKSIVEYLFSGMLNTRFDEMSKKPDPAFISAALSGPGTGLESRAVTRFRCPATTVLLLLYMPSRPSDLSNRSCSATACG